ncbi:hypothetical protein PACTADRAFT_2025 [Pachysolen tannophilus NRRL Y-2460]|uniref:Uncharacterized protein n=1 Tax=Pachysolen tannophilus NRRL Y-2460 TaxID=669874 RepID=A0A1E4U0K7_PACTA|nr:hypothetical protein PACTADRAFT_2025 [Pachysolen tannophilus NRRL Y-2460]
MPPRNIEEFLYDKLMKSATFHKFVRTIHAKINGLPPPHIQDRQKIRYNSSNQYDYLFRPTRLQKANAFRLLFLDELKKSFFLKK